MQKWEYRIVHLSDQPERLEAELNVFGSDGWELVGMSPYQKQTIEILPEIGEVISMVTGSRCVIKRPFPVAMQLHYENRGVHHG